MEIDYFAPGRCKIVFPENAVHTNKNDYKTEASEEVVEYEIIYRDEKVIVAVYDDSELGKIVRTLNFINCDTYWVYLGGGNVVDLNMREYFKKID